MNETENIAFDIIPVIVDNDALGASRRKRSLNLTFTDNEENVIEKNLHGIFKRPIDIALPVVDMLSTANIHLKDYIEAPTIGEI